MSFLSIATPFVALGIPVFPLTPKTKIPPAGFHFLEEATIDPVKVASWNDENPDYNVALLANGEFCFLEFDVAKGMSAAAAEMEHEIPLTRTQVSGKGFGHYIFRHTERSRALGNRSVNLPEGGEWFSFRAGNKYLVGAGSLHPNGSYYQTKRDIEPIPMPDWLSDFVEKHSTPARPKPCDNAVEVADDFDFDDLTDFYGIGIVGEKDDVWQVVQECPGVGYRHSGSTLTAFYWDGSSLGWSCFAQGSAPPAEPYRRTRQLRSCRPEMGVRCRGRDWISATAGRERARGDRRRPSPSGEAVKPEQEVAYAVNAGDHLK